MNLITSHREAFKWAAELLEMTMDGVTDQQAQQIPPGIANPLGATYAHALIEVDVIINTLFQNQNPLFETTWAGRTGISEPQWLNAFDWARRVKIELPTARAYAQAVYAEADAFIAALTENDLSGEIDLTDAGLGVRSLNWCLNALVTGHTNNMAGEISALKGIQGAKGYPF